jgi:Leucine-rich repeat (LRR) protein
MLRIRPFILDPTVFLGLRQLTELNLGDNLIKTLDSPKFVFTPNLRFLNLQNNRLAFVATDAFKGLSALEVLDISSNWIGSIHPDTFSPLPPGMKEQIILDENPLFCDCEIRHMVSWISRWPNRVKNGNTLVCSHMSGPSGKNAGKKLTSLKSHDLCDWLAELRNMILVPIAILITISMTIVITCLCRRKGSSGSMATMSTIYHSNFYDIDSLGAESSQHGGMVSDNTHSTTVPFQYTRKIQLPASLVPVDSPVKRNRNGMKQLERLSSIDDFQPMKSENDAMSGRYSDDTNSNSSFDSSSEHPYSEYDRTSLSYSEDGN